MNESTKTFIADKATYYLLKPIVWYALKVKQAISGSAHPDQVMYILLLPLAFIGLLSKFDSAVASFISGGILNISIMFLMYSSWKCAFNTKHKISAYLIRGLSAAFMLLYITDVVGLV